jgi:hypothetical protein
MNQENQANKIHRIIARCWSDEDFKKKLLADPLAILQADGVILSPDVTVTVLEDTAELLHLVIPVNPTELSDEDLNRIAGGDSIDSGQQGG